MPQRNPGGKFVFGKSLVRPDLSLSLPPQAIEEYLRLRWGPGALFWSAQKITPGSSRSIDRKNLWRIKALPALPL